MMTQGSHSQNKTKKSADQRHLSISRKGLLRSDVATKIIELYLGYRPIQKALLRYHKVHKLSGSLDKLISEVSTSYADLRRLQAVQVKYGLVHHRAAEGKKSKASIRCNWTWKLE